MLHFPAQWRKFIVRFQCALATECTRQCAQCVLKANAAHRTLSSCTNTLLSRGNEVHCRATSQFFRFFFPSPSFLFDSDATIMSGLPFRKLTQLQNYRRSNGGVWGRDKARLIDLCSLIDRSGAKMTSRGFRMTVSLLPRSLYNKMPMSLSLSLDVPRDLPWANLFTNEWQSWCAHFTVSREPCRIISYAVILLGSGTYFDFTCTAEKQITLNKVFVLRILSAKR